MLHKYGVYNKVGNYGFYVKYRLESSGDGSRGIPGGRTN